MSTIQINSLNQRKKDILQAVVNSYLKSGEPVGSKCLAEEFNISSATIRNEMASMSELGLLLQPHTSSGRIPSDLGYRLFLDHIMQKPVLNENEKKILDDALNLHAYEPERLIENVASALTEITRYAVMTSLPSGSGSIVKGVQFVQTSRRTAMIILMTSIGTMETQVFKCNFDVTPDLMRIFFRVFNNKIAGMPVDSITPSLISQMASSLEGDVAMVMSPALVALLQVARDSVRAKIHLDGETKLLFYKEFTPQSLRLIVDFLESKREMNALLFQPTEKSCNNVKVFIGRENLRDELNNASMLMTEYIVNGQNAGTIGVIGPTRMDYAKVIACLEYLSKQVGDMLTDLLLVE